jgi:sugar lactone lactonase YvrE
MNLRSWIDCGNGLGEGPLWCPLSQFLWWLDVADPHLFCANAQGQLLNRWKLPKYPGSMALRHDGSLLLMFRHGPAIFQPLDGSVQWLDVPGLDLGETRFNDGKCDRLGRFWSGTMDRRTERAIGSLYRMDGLQRIRQMDASGVTIANGIAWSPDNRTMYFADTPAACIYAYDHDLERGEISHRRVFAQFKSGEGGPDGLTVDSEGGVWCALFNRSELHHIAPSGQPIQVIDLPVQQPTSVMFGGPDLGTLFITTARIHLSSAQLQNQPWAGHVLCFEPGVKGLPEPRCAF